MPIFTRVKFYINIILKLVAGVLFVILGLSGEVHGEWAVDFSKRFKEQRKGEMKESAPEGRAQDTTIFDHLISVQSRDGVQEIVILNTEAGFIPNTVRVREGESYKIHVVNVNEKEKNVSFVMDSFSEHHATYFGKMRSFVMSPKKEGIYSFVCPETSAQGRVVVHAVSAEAGIRRPASEE
jgi:hypothetical protein